MPIQAVSKVSHVPASSETQSCVPVKKHAPIFNFIRTHTVVISNQGTATAKNVRIGHYFLPAYSVSPPLSMRNPENLNEIIIPTLCPKEFFTVSYLYPRPILWREINAYFKCDDGAAEIANLQDISIKSSFLIWLMRAIFFLGVFSAIYFSMKISPALYRLYLLSNS